MRLGTGSSLAGQCPGARVGDHHWSRVIIRVPRERSGRISEYWDNGSPEFRNSVQVAAGGFRLLASLRAVMLDPVSVQEGQDGLCVHAHARIQKLVLDLAGWRSRRARRKS